MKKLNLSFYIDRKSQANQGQKFSTLVIVAMLYAYYNYYNLIRAIMYIGNSNVIYTTSNLNKGVI